MPPSMLQSLHQPSLVTYTLPGFARSVANAVDAWRPKHKLILGTLKTPAFPWFKYKDFNIHIKRDDLTGCELSGNKVRKLEYLLADAVARGCRAVITCGGIQSNHCRATAACAARLGLECHLFLRTNLDVIPQADQVRLNGNLLLDFLFGAYIYLVPLNEAYETHLKPRMHKLAESLQQDKGLSAYLIPVGGSNCIGSLGYLQAYDEMLSMNQLDGITDICFACGSGGTAAGLAVANFLAQTENKSVPRVDVHAVSVCDDADYFYAHVAHIMTDYGLTSSNEHSAARRILNVIDGYKAPGYAKSTREHVELIQQVAAHTGVVLDPVYSGKALYGVMREIDKGGKVFRGKNILFIMTGGVFANFDGRWEDKSLLSAAECTSRMEMFRE